MSTYTVTTKRKYKDSWSSIQQKQFSNYSPNRNYIMTQNIYGEKHTSVKGWGEEGRGKEKEENEQGRTILNKVYLATFW